MIGMAMLGFHPSLRFHPSRELHHFSGASEASRELHIAAINSFTLKLKQPDPPLPPQGRESITTSHRL